MPKRKTTLTVFAIYLLALVVRLLPVIVAREMTIGLDDMFQYDMLARSLAAGEGYRWYSEPDLALAEKYFPFEAVIGDYDPRGVLTSFRAPGYPFFLSLIYRLVGLEDRFFIARLVQAFFMAFIAPLTFFLSRRLFPENLLAAAWCGIGVAVYPYFVVYPLGLASEVVFIPLVLAGLLAVLNAGESGTWWMYLLAGLLFGAAALTRSVVVFILPIVLLWIWIYGKQRWGVLILLAAVLVFVFPWSVRNTRLHGQFTFIENNLGYTTYLGYHPETGGRFQYPQSTELLPYLDDAERNRIGIERTLEFIKADPGRVPGLMLMKLSDFFGLERKVLTYFYSNNFVGHIPQPWLALLFLVYLAPFAVISLLFAISLPAIKWTPPRLLAAGVIAFYLIPHLVLLAEPRFHLTILPLMTIFAMHTWINRQESIARLTTGGFGWPAVLALVLVGLLLLNWGFEIWQDWAMLRELMGPKGNRMYLDY